MQPDLNGQQCARLLSALTTQGCRIETCRLQREQVCKTPALGTVFKRRTAKDDEIPVADGEAVTYSSLTKENSIQQKATGSKGEDTREPGFLTLEDESVFSGPIAQKRETTRQNSKIQPIPGIPVKEKETSVAKAKEKGRTRRQMYISPSREQTKTKERIRPTPHPPLGIQQTFPLELTKPPLHMNGMSGTRTAIMLINHGSPPHTTSNSQTRITLMHRNEGGHGSKEREEQKGQPEEVQT